ncbi:unnamed protein product [Penicillium egyptiacum]|uniref:Chromo domain-containing protein n=1 Tax=Penicillium egyptiacum TaxID=1303716 RepID=A0A9W4P3S5_9EURO|nr:unnamed protein product [Penicillium egyptiacum]
MMFREQPHSPKLDSHHRNNTDRPPATTVVIGDSSESSDGSDSDDQEWPIKCILRETDTEYLIDWEGPYDPTWEPKENASELAIQVWNKRKARRPSELDRKSTRGRIPQSPSVIEVSSSSSEANIGPGDRYCTPFDETHQSDADSDSHSRASSSLFVQQEGLSEIVDSLQSQYIGASGCSHGTDSPSRSLSDCSSPLAAVSTNSCSQAGATLFEYIPESSSPPEYLQPGEWDDVNTQQPGPTCDSKANSINSCLSRQQYSAEINNVVELSNPNTPGVGLSSKVSEIAETPVQPPGPGADFSYLGSFPPDNTPSHNNLTSQPSGSCGSIVRDCEFVQSTYLSSIPERVFQYLSQHPEELSSGSTRPVRSFSNLVEEEPSAEIMEDKEPKLSDPSLSDAPLDRYSQLPGSTPTEKIRNAWARLSEENQSELSQTANVVETPSSVGDIEASIPVSVPEATAPLSVRPDTDSFSHSHTAVHHGHSEPLLPPSELAHGGHMSQPSLQTIQPSALTVTGMDDEVVPGSVHLGPSEFAVTLPMDSRVKDDYERVLSDAATSIRQFFDSFQSNTQISEPEREGLHSHMWEVIARLSNVSTHPDLNISDHLKDADPDLAKEASWAEYSSAKFLFLGHLMEIVGTHELHLILAVQDEKKQAVLERYLQGKGFAYTRPREEMGSTLEVSLAKESLSFGIHSSETARELYKPPSAIFALDSYFRPRSPSMQHLRTTYARNGSLLPVIWFLVANTSEHIERCLPDSPEPDRLRLLVHYIARLHDEVGDLQDDALGVHEDAEEILGYLLDPLAGWPLPTIEPLSLVSLEELECYSSSSDEAMPPAQKRTLDEQPEGPSSKRARVGTQENSPLTESTKPPSQTLDRDLQSLEKNLIQMKQIHASEKAQLQADLAHANSRFEEMEKALGILQHRYESRTKELHATRQERDRLAENNPTLERRVEKQNQTISSLKEERAELKHELDEARQALRDGGGSPAELETAREEIRRLARENSNLERKAEFEKNQSEYMREQYQTASTAAAQSGTESRHLAAENEKLKRKADSNAVQLGELHMKDESVRHIARIEELELILATRDEFLRRKEDELREIRKNRPSTRSTSTQPRSPKWSGSRPTSPGVGHNGNGNGGLGGRGSALRYSSEMPF